MSSTEDQQDDDNWTYAEYAMNTALFMFDRVTQPFASMFSSEVKPKTTQDPFEGIMTEEFEQKLLAQLEEMEATQIIDPFKEISHLFYRNCSTDAEERRYSFEKSGSIVDESEIEWAMENCTSYDEGMRQVRYKLSPETWRDFQKCAKEILEKCRHERENQ